MGIFQRKIAVVIGINNYKHGIAPLTTAVQDASELTKLLADEYHYEVLCLLDQEANLARLRHLLEHQLPKKINPKENDQLLFYFAGHGTAVQSNKGPAGYVIPQDAKPEAPQMFLPMQELNQSLIKLNCRHFLAIFDCCFAGTFRWSSTRDILTAPEKVYRELFARYRDYPAWQVITSTSYNQKALDVFLDNRGQADKNKKHSPFATALFEALRGRADFIPDGIITATELYLYIRDRVESISEEQQTPGLWPLEKHDRGEYIFLMNSFDERKLENAPILKPENNPYRGLESFEEIHAAFFFGRDYLIDKLYKYCKNSSLIAVLGASGTGKSSLVKAGLIPYLKQSKLINKRLFFADHLVQETWYIFEPFRPGIDPFLSLAQSLVANGTISLTDEILKALMVLDEIFVKEASQLPRDLYTEWICSTTEKKLTLTVTFSSFFEDFSKTKPTTKNAFIYIHMYVQENINNLSNLLKEDKNALTQCLANCFKKNQNNKFLIVIDQSEELVTLVSSKDLARQFLRSLEHALEIFTGQLSCILTLRLDFEPLVAELLPNSMSINWAEKKRFIVPPMRQSELRDAIKKPAEETALYFEPPQLVDRLINEVEQMPGALPLLSFVLSELYIRCYKRYKNSYQNEVQNRLLTEEDYNDLQGVVGSLRRRANQEFEETLNKEDRRTLRNLMLRMVAVEGGELARRRVQKSELVYPDARENERVNKVVNIFVNARLLVTGTTPQGEYIEPAHDALVKGWEKITTWLEEKSLVTPTDNSFKILFGNNFDRIKRIFSNLNIFKNKNTKVRLNHINRMENKKQFKVNLSLQRQVSIAALDWHAVRVKGGKKLSKKLLWSRDIRLPLLEQIIKSNDNWLNRLETEFITSSIKQRTERFFHSIIFISSINISLLILMIIAFNMWRQSEINQADILARSSLALAETDQKLEALIEAIKAGVKAKKHNIHSNLVLTALQNSISKVKEKNRLVGHTDYVNSISISKDGELIASASKDNTIKLWDKQGKIISIIRGHEDKINHVSFSPSAQRIISASDDGIAKLWNNNGDLLSEFKHKDGTINSAVFSPDNKMVATAGSDKKIKIWNLKGGLIKTLYAHDRSVSDVRFSPNGGIIASASDDGTVKIWNINGELINSLDDGLHRIHCLNFSPNSQMLVTGSSDSKIKIWDVKGELIKVIEGHDRDVFSVDFSPDSQRVVSAGRDNKVKVWNIEGKLLNTFSGHNDWVRSATIHPKNLSVISGSDDGTIRIWEIENNWPVKIKSSVIKKSEDWIGGIAFNPVKKNFIAADQSGFIHFWDYKGVKIKELKAHQDRIFDLEFRFDGRSFASASQDKTVKLWSHSGALLKVFRHESEVYDVNFSPDGKIIASANRNKTVKLWDINGQLFKILNGHKGDVTSISFNPNGQTLASASTDATVKIWNMAKLVRTLRGHTNHIYSVRYSPDGQFIATAGRDKTVRLWNSEGQLIKEFIGHTDYIYTVSFSPDSQTIVSAGRTIKIWNKEGKLLQTLTYSEAPIRSIEFSPDREILASLHQDGAVILWNLKELSLDKLLQRSCYWVRDYLENNKNIEESDRRICSSLIRKFNQ